MSDPNAGLILILRKTRPWVYSLSIVGFFFAACMAFAGSVALMGSTGQAAEAHPLALVIYPIGTALYLIPSLYLYRFARRIDLFVAQGHTAQLEAALEAQRRFWKFLAIVVVVTVVLAVGALIALMVVGDLTTV